MSPCRPRSWRCWASCGDRLGTAILLITHNMGVVADLADRVLVMRSGRMVERGEVVSLFSRPVHRLHPGPARGRAAAARGRANPGPRRSRPTPCPRPSIPRQCPRPSLIRRRLPPCASWTPASTIPGASVGRPSVPCQRDHAGRAARPVLGIVGESGSGKSTLAKAAVGNLPGEPRPDRCWPARICRRPDGPSCGGSGAGSESSIRTRRPRSTRCSPSVRASPSRCSSIGWRPARSCGPASAALLEERRAAAGVRAQATARAVRWPAPARRPGAGAGPSTRAADRRRADQRAGCVGAGRGSWRCSRDCGPSYGFACVFISHDLAVVNEVSDNVLVLRGGRIVETGPTREVLLHAPGELHPAARAGPSGARSGRAAGPPDPLNPPARRLAAKRSAAGVRSRRRRGCPGPLPQPGSAVCGRATRPG